jgi:cytochrome oxidase Cu insertion factor (SCO1/SenC/PrrC family)
MNDKHMKTVQILKYLKLTLVCVLLLLANCVSAYSTPDGFYRQSDTLYLDINLRDARQTDTLSITIDDLFHTLNSTPRETFFALPSKIGIYKFKIPLQKSYGYFTLSKSRSVIKPGFEDFVPITKSQFWEAGDRLFIDIRFKESMMGFDGQCKYSGPGADKYNAAFTIEKYEISMEELKKSGDDRVFRWDGNILTYKDFAEPGKHVKDRLALLKPFQTKISKRSYQVLKANIIYEGTGTIGRIKEWARNGGMANLNASDKKSIIQQFNQSFEPQQYDLDPNFLACSYNYIVFSYIKFQAASALKTGAYTLGQVYKDIISWKASQESKEIMLILALLRITYNAENATAVYDKAATFIKNPEYLEVLKSLSLTAPGHLLKEFNLTDTNGQSRRLGEFLGKVVLVDIWFTGCGGCEDYYRNVLSKVKPFYKDNSNVEFVSISIDKNRETWKSSINSCKYSSPDGLNLYTQGEGSNHKFITANSVLSYPCIILLDKEGKVKNFRSENLRQVNTLHQAIRELL